MRPYPIRIFDWLSQGVNTVIFNGKPDESLSGRAYRMEYESRFWAFMRRFIDGVFFWQEAHCRASYMADIDRLIVRLEAHRRLK